MIAAKTKLHYVTCPNCGKNIKLESPERFREPRKIEVAVGNNPYTFAHRKTNSFCAHCLNTVSVLWYF
jgi:hypothetical protein